MLKKASWPWFVCALFIVLFATPRVLFAQQGAGVLTGTATDTSSKRPLADVVVTATSPALQGEQTVVTDSSGLYRIPDLPPGVYTLLLDKENYRPYSRDGIALRADTTLRVNAELLPESLSAEEVTVVARPPTVDVGSSSTGMSISSDFTQRIPVSAPGAKGSTARSFESVAEVVPGAHDDTYGVSINGTTSPENSYVIDGTSVNNPGVGTIGSPLSIEFIKEVNVITGGYLPEYGRATGGILNVVTKSGSNEFHGGAFQYYSPGALEGTKRVVQHEGQSILTKQRLSYIYDIGADVGGPIRKDKLWFYVGFDFGRSVYKLDRDINATELDAMGSPITDSATGFTRVKAIPGTNHSYVARLTQFQAIAKLTYAVNQDNQISVTFFALPSQSGGHGTFPLDPQTGVPSAVSRMRGASGSINGTIESTSTLQIANAYDTRVKWSMAVENKRILLDTTIGWHHESLATLPSDGTEPGSTDGLAGRPLVGWRRTSPTPHSITDFEPVPDPTACASVVKADGTIAIPCPLQSYSTGGPGNIDRQMQDRYQARSVLTLLFQGTGHHVVKAGVDAEITRFDHLSAFSGTIRYREPADGTAFIGFSYGFLQAPDDPVVLQQLHTISNSLNVGAFLQDSWSILDKVTLNVGVRCDAQFLYNSAGERSLSLPNEWSPRIGAIYDPSQAGRAKIFASYARFYESVPLDIADRALSSEPGLQTLHKAGSAASPCSRTMAISGPCPDEPNRSLILDQVGVGSAPIDPNLKPQSSDEMVMGAEHEVVKDGRLGFSYTKRWMNYAVEDMSRDEATTYFIGNPGYGIASDFPKAERNYDAVGVYLTKTWADSWLALASYTWSYLRGNIAGLYNPGTGQLDPNINTDFDLKSLLANGYGPLPGDRTHQIKLFGAKDWPINRKHHVMSGVALRAHSGEPTSFLGSHPVYLFGQVFILDRGSGERLPWVYGADLQVGYRYELDKTKTVQVTIDIFNLFNFQTPTARDEEYTRTEVVPVKNGDISSLKHADGTPFDPTTDKNPNFSHPTQYQAPRQFRFGLRTTF
jgi:hypothetical protein